MPFWLARQQPVESGGQRRAHIQRFDPRFWTVNFPRPMMAAVTATAADALRVDTVFHRSDDLAGLIWDSTDRFDHPLLSYDTDGDYRRTTLSFRWQSSGVMPLDAVNGPTLTIEGRDEDGTQRGWYVRLWNYAVGTPQDAQITLPFSALNGGFLLPSEADPVFAGAIDRMFISLVPPGFNPNGAPLATPQEGWVELTDIRCDGARAMLPIGDVMLPPHGLSMATAYDDSFNLTPQRMIRNLHGLGYRGAVNHYVGMSHYFALLPQNGALLVDPAKPLNAPCITWHKAFLAEAKLLGLSPILSLSYELFDAHCPDGWKQRDHLGNPALTGWVPPSALLSPANGAAMGWLQSVGVAFTGLMADAGLPVRFQIGEPWWWVTAAGRICIYDDAAKAALGGNPPVIANLRQPLDAPRKALLDSAGAVLVASTAALANAVRASVAPASAELLLLIYLPTILDDAMPEARRANLPAGWAYPAFDVLQIEDYDWVTQGRSANRRAALAAVDDRLGYPLAKQQYMAGFVLNADDADAYWPRIAAALAEAEARGFATRIVWALPQVCRDGLTIFATPEDDVRAFDDVLFPLALGQQASVSASFSTSIVTTASGFEHRGSGWADARLSFDAGPGLRSEAELGTLIAFFRARRGAARGFRFRDPTDHSSNGMTGTPTPADQVIGIGDGAQSRFRLVKHYGDPGDEPQQRLITHPDAATLLVSIDGTATSAFTLLPGGVIDLDDPLADSAELRAGFLFDVPVRFAEDRLDVNGASFAAGEIPSVPLIEIRGEGA